MITTSEYSSLIEERGIDNDLDLKNRSNQDLEMLSEDNNSSGQKQNNYEEDHDYEAKTHPPN